MSNISRALSFGLAVGTVVALAGGQAIAQRAQANEECRAPIRAQCAAAADRRSCVIAMMQTLPDSCRKQISQAAADRAPRTQGMIEYAYGADPLQKLDFKRAAGVERAPLIVFVHGGGWSIGDKAPATGAKADHFAANGFAFASLNYRLVPAATVEQQASDIAAAIAYLRAHAAEQGINPDRIVIMGHSSGAHLAALVASDPGYLSAARVPFAALKGVVLLDGAGYDVPKQIASPVNRVEAMYAAAFGTEPARQQRLSPYFRAAAPNAPKWLLLAIAQRADSTAQSEVFAAALIKAGSAARVVRIKDSSHAKLNQQLGKTGDAATAEVDGFLAAL